MSKLYSTKYKMQGLTLWLQRYLSRVLVVLLASHSFSVMAEMSDKLSISGFGNITAGYLDTDEANFKGYSDEVSLEPDSLVGLQVSYAFTPSLSATVQGRLYADDNDSIINWAYLTWQPDDNLLIKAGRQRTPFFALSDVVEVGYSYPWITAPTQIYSSWLFPTFDGIDLAWGYSSGNVDTTLEGYVGRYDGDVEFGIYTTNYAVDIFSGLIAKVNWNSFEFRASFHRGNVDIGFTQFDALSDALIGAGFTDSANALSREGWVQGTQLSVSYENLDYFARAEWMRLEAEMTMVPELESYYLMGGYNFYPFSVYLTYAESSAEKIKFPNEIPYTDGANPQVDFLYETWQGFTNDLVLDELRSWTLGARWDVIPKVALKAELTLLDGHDGSSSFFDSFEDSFDRDASLYKLSVEWVF